MVIPWCTCIPAFNFFNASLLCIDKAGKKTNL